MGPQVQPGSSPGGGAAGTASPELVLLTLHSLDADVARGHTKDERFRSGVTRTGLGLARVPSGSPSGRLGVRRSPTRCRLRLHCRSTVESWHMQAARGGKGHNVVRSFTRNRSQTSTVGESVLNPSSRYARTPLRTPRWAATKVCRTPPGVGGEKTGARADRSVITTDCTHPGVCQPAAQ